MSEENFQQTGSIYYRNNERLKRSGAQLEYTQEQIDEYIKCSQDAVYFIKKYVKIVVLDHGVIPFELWPFQEKLIHLMHNNRFVIANILRQVGKTSTVVAYFLWLSIFTDSLNMLIAANKRQTAEDILGKYILAYEHLPMWLQQGIVTWNKGSIELENGTKIRATSTTSGSARSGTYNIVLLDEFAHIEPNLAEDFYTSVYPVISSGKESKIFMISTPKGMNLFHKFWSDAISGENKFIPFEVHWSDVPGRDQIWYEDTIRNIGELRFSQEFECQFLGSSDTLISGKKLQQLATNYPKYRRNEVAIYEEPIKELWNEEEQKFDSIEHKYVMVVDTAEGKKLDYSAFTVIDITEIPYKVVATYRDNTISPILYPTIIADTARYFNNAYILIETQSVGMQVGESLLMDLEYENLLRCSSGNKKAQEIIGGYKSGSYIGVRSSSQVKKVGCMNFKTLIETDKLLFSDLDIKEELSHFILSSNGTYAAEKGEHDDLVITLVLFGWLTTQTFFKEIVDHDLRKQLKQQYMNNVQEDESLPDIVVDDGKPKNYIFMDKIFWVVDDGNTPINNNDIYRDYIPDLLKY